MKKWLFSTAGLSIALLALLLFLLISCRGGSDADIYIYHFNPSTMMLEAEARSLPTRDQIFETVVSYIYSEPRAGSLLSTWPHELAPYKSDLVQAIIHEDEMLLVFFASIFNHIAPLEQSLFKTAFILTMESLTEMHFPHINRMKILVSDDYEYAYNTLMLSLSATEGDEIPDVPWLIFDGVYGVYNDPILSSAHTLPMIFTHLHFVDETGTGLVIKTYESDEVEQHIEERSRYALLLIINEFKPDGVIFPIPPETVIHRVIVDGDHFWVDFSIDFIDRFEGDRSLARLMIYSIVNTLVADIPRRRVNFMIDGRQHEEFHGIANFDQPFERDETLLLSYIIEQREREAWRDLD